MNISKIYFSYYQVKDNIFLNLTRKIAIKKLISRALQASGIEGGTFENSLGFWKGKTEPSIVGTIANATSLQIESLAKNLKTILNQDSVMIEIKNKVKFI